MRVKVTPGYKEEQCAPALGVEMKKPVDLEAPITRYTLKYTNPHVLFTILFLDQTGCGDVTRTCRLNHIGDSFASCHSKCPISKQIRSTSIQISRCDSQVCLSTRPKLQWDLCLNPTLLHKSRFISDSPILSSNGFSLIGAIFQLTDQVTWQ